MHLPPFATRLLPLLLLGVAPLFAAEAPKHWPENAFVPLTLERIAALPPAQQPAWRSYWEASTARNQLVGERDLVDHSLQKPSDGPPIPSTYSKGVRLNAAPAWYASEEARVLADHVVNWQTPAGGWVKTGDYSRPRKPEDDHHDAWSGGTFDNDSTIYELRYLALVNAAASPAEQDSPRAKAWRDCFFRGLDYVFAAQYPNGGFPQVYPLVGWYHDAVTFNDDAMVHILQLLQDLATRKPEFAFVPAKQSELARVGLARGLHCILATQLKAPDGTLTIWPQQVDPITLQPCAARNFEPISECSNESVGLAEFLMNSQRQASPALIAAVDGAVAWFHRHALHGVVWDRNRTEGTGLVPRTDAPDLWARFYEIGTGKPIFGDRDRTIHYAVAELSNERRRGYGWFNSRALALFPAYEAWKKSAAEKTKT